MFLTLSFILYTVRMYIGVDIGGSKILVAGSTDGRTIAASQKIATPPDAKQGVMEIIHLIEAVADRSDVQAIGVSFAGPVDPKNGKTLLPPHIHGWKNFDLLSPLRSHFGVPVALENDAQLAGLAEARFGNGQNYRSVLYITISTGIGTSLIIDDQIYHGAHSLEGGHITLDPNGPECGCGGRGHFDAIVSGSAIVKQFGRPAKDIPASEVKTWDTIGKNLSVGVASLITALSPHIVILGGGVSVHYDKFKDPLHKYLSKYPLLYPCPPVVQAKFVETAPIYGAFSLAQQL